VLAAVHLSAATLWYNGDLDLRQGLFNGINTNAVSLAIAYDNFVVPAGETWSITSAWSNDLMSFTGVTTADWEIRTTGFAVGSVLVASGTSAATQTATGRSDAGFAEYTILATGLNVTLGPGTYWLGIAPVGFGSGDQSFITTTSGANCVGLPCGNDGNSYWTATSPFNFTFVPTTNPNAIGPGQTWDLSMGLGGTLVAPEPASVAFMLAGLLAIGVYHFRRSRFN
jgi:hypothetical protein